MSAREEEVFMAAHVAAAVITVKLHSLNNNNTTQSHNGLISSVMFPAEDVCDCVLSVNVDFSPTKARHVNSLWLHNLLYMA